MTSYKSPSSGAPTTMVRRLDIGGENVLLPFLREYAEIMCGDPGKFGVIGHKVSQLLPTQTINSIDLSLLVLDPEEPLPPLVPSLEDFSPPLSTTVPETVKDPPRRSAKVSSPAEPEGKEEEIASGPMTVSLSAEKRFQTAKDLHHYEVEKWKVRFKRYCDEIEDIKKHDMAALALLMQHLTPASKTRLNTSFLAEYTEATKAK